MGIAAARRTALAAQGFADPRPAGSVTRRHLLRVLSRIRLLQLDSVNVVTRAHHVPVASRLGPYPRELLDRAAWSHSVRRPRLLVECWAHEASLVPVRDWPLVMSSIQPHRFWQGAGQRVERDPVLVADVLAVVKEHGPIGAGAVERELGGSPRPAGGWWNRSEVKRVCEWLFGIGELTTGSRRHFERLYDLPERVLPREVLHAPRPDPADAVRRLVGQAATALGVATEPDLRDYYRIGHAASKRAVAELVEAGELEPVRVRGWTAPAYRHRDARTPRRIPCAALLCPFDPLIWCRERTERLFGFRYRIEIYVPERQRTHGYYVFPFLLDGELVARVDLKADRTAGVLRVPGAFAERGVDTGRIVPALTGALGELAGWLGLDGVAVGESGDLAAPLRVQS
ncbi:MAG TPA: crosslink repair DNA glycosylase YcaQ family protein [Pseudonocardiaceae bacterium]|jgi:uncharacterized protein YcaQ|nr:crosslink repair DNA glycosylase YcaQ family protein [Pseudonocardiaceae bacterium]